MTIRLDAHKPEFHRGAPPQLPVLCATTANITIATALNAGDTIDGVTLAAGNRVLVKNQSTGSQNGIYVAGATPVRADDMAEGVAAWGAVLYVIAGTTNGGTIWRNTNTSLPTIDSTALTWTQFSGGTGVAADTIWDAKGDLAVGTGADAAARLAVGSNDQIPMADSAATVGIKWVGSQTPTTQAFSDAAAEGTADTYARGDHKHGMPASPGGGGSATAFVGARAYQAGTAQSIANATLTAVTFDSERFDSDGFHSTSSNTSRFTVPAGMGGKYLIGGVVEFAANATGARSIAIKLNGATYLGIETVQAATAGGQETRLGIDVVYDLAAGDYVEVFVSQVSGGALNIGNTSAYGAEGWVVKFGSAGLGTAVGARVYNSAAINLNNGSDTFLTFDSERYDSDGFHSTSANTGRLTIPAGMGGKYSITLNVGISPNVTSGYSFIKLNGTTIIAVSSAGEFVSGANLYMVCSTDYDLAAGDYVEAGIQVTPGSKTALAAGNFSPEFMLHRIDGGVGSNAADVAIADAGGYYTSTDVEGALAEIGAGGIGGGGSGTAFVGASVYHSTTQASPTVIAFDSEIFDTDGFHSTSSNTSRLTIPAGLGGKYLVTFTSFVSAGGLDIRIRLNGGSTNYIGPNWAVADPASERTIQGAVVLDLAAGDYIEFHNASGTGTYGNAGSSYPGVAFAAASQATITKLAGGSLGNAVGASVRASANQTVNNGNALFDTEEWDTDGFHSTTSNTDRLTVPAGLGGKYLVTASAGLTTANALDMRFFVNGSQQRVWAQSSALGGGSELMSIAGVVDLAAGDYVTVNCYTAGANRTLYGASGGFSSSFSMVRLDAGTQLGLYSARAKRTAGSLTLNSTSWANVDTGLDLTVKAVAGDILAISVVGLVGNQNVSMGFDAVTVVSGSAVNSVSGASGASDYGFLFASAAQELGITGTIQYPVVSGDISGGQVTLRFRYRGSSATNRTLYAGTAGDPQFNWSVVNLGQRT